MSGKHRKIAPRLFKRLRVDFHNPVTTAHIDFRDQVRLRGHYMVQVGFEGRRLQDDFIPRRGHGILGSVRHGSLKALYLATVADDCGRLIRHRDFESWVGSLVGQPVDLYALDERNLTQLEDQYQQCQERYEEWLDLLGEENLLTLISEDKAEREALRLEVAEECRGPSL